MRTSRARAVGLLAVALLVGGLSAACASGPIPTASTAAASSTVAAGSSEPGPTPTPEQILLLENRGGPDFDVYVNNVLATTIQCGGFGSIDGNEWPLPWNLGIQRVGEKALVLSQTVTKLPAWLIQFGTRTPSFSQYPNLSGPELDCPSYHAGTPGASAVPSR